MFRCYEYKCITACTRAILISCQCHFVPPVGLCRYPHGDAASAGYRLRGRAELGDFAETSLASEQVHQLRGLLPHLPYSPLHTERTRHERSESWSSKIR